MRYRSVICFGALVLVCLMALSVCTAWAISPVCVTFNDGQMHGWQAAAIGPKVGFSVPSSGGPDGTPYLHCKDQSGPSVIQAGPDLRGDWTTLGCGQFCFDLKIFNDGDVNAHTSITPSFTILFDPDGPNTGVNPIRAQWVATTTVTEMGGAKPGWHRFCAPLGPLCNGALPSNSGGAWHMLDGQPNSAFQTVLQNVTDVYFPVDFTSNPAEEVGYDNVCLSAAVCACETFCGPCMKIWREKVLCKPAPGNLFTYSFLVTNLSGKTIQSINIVPPTGKTVTPSVIVGPIIPNGSKSVTLTIGGATSGQQVCLAFRAVDTAGKEFCCTKQCITMPMCECVQVSNDYTGCTQWTSNGLPTYTFTLDNLGLPISDFFIIPTPSTAVLSRQWFHFATPVPQYGSFGTHTISISGVAPGTQVCLRFVFINTASGNHECCSIDRCFVVPDCNPIPCCITGAEFCCPPPACCIPIALAMPDGDMVSLSHKTVTGSIGRAAWIEETDRTSALLLDTDAGLAPGDVVDVSGEMTTIGYNRALIVHSIQKTNPTPPPPPIRPIAMGNAAIGGQDPNEWSFGVTGGTGPNNVGLLVTTWGRVTAIGPGYFYLDDGSGLRDPTGNVGVRVFTEGLTDPSLGSFVTATGLVSASEHVPTGESIRVLVPRTQADIGGATPGPPASRNLSADRFANYGVGFSE